ncbi:MAG: CDP-diacylglycerol--serine O-phosphatidyltransferase, partial [Bacteroidales bacterium]|nr:CDP-diacylglycerol--serine O-phosphatidyltransferase [Bacteroidales bacterium]
MNIRKHIPNSITSMNLLCGVMGVIFALEGRLDIAFPLMILGALFDFCDGLAARLLKAYSDIGKELDSLSDMISFGVLPSVMLYKTMANVQDMCWACYLPLVLAVFSGLRLAKFNIDERQHESFIGLPTPAAAMICGSFAYCIAIRPEYAISSLATNCWSIPVLAIILS